MFLSRWGDRGSPTIEFGEPTGVATDANGNIYVVDALYDNVQKFGQPPTPVLSNTWGRLKSLYRR